ncbi:MAG: hypothetical protein WC526_00475 [Patescibacteria group bacterium]
MLRKKIIHIFFLLGFLLFPLCALGMMSSTNYTIYADTVDSGGVYSSGGAYTLQDSAGESPAGFTTSSIYEVRGGYQAMERSSISLTLSSASLDLGTMSVSQVNSASTTASVVTNSESGYSLSVGSVSGSSLTGVADGSVTAGSEEYGVSLDGSDKLFSDDESITAGLGLASSSTPITSAGTILTFKAAIGSGTTAGARSQTITLTASANF